MVHQFHLYQVMVLYLHLESTVGSSSIPVSYEANGAGAGSAFGMRSRSQFATDYKQNVVQSTIKSYSHKPRIAASPFLTQYQSRLGGIARPGIGSGMGMGTTMRASPIPSIHSPSVTLSNANVYGNGNGNVAASGEQEQSG